MTDSPRPGLDGWTADRLEFQHAAPRAPGTPGPPDL